MPQYYLMDNVFFILKKKKRNHAQSIKYMTMIRENISFYLQAYLYICIATIKKVKQFLFESLFTFGLKS